jgi:protein gp37
MSTSTIEWTEVTWNPTTGCDRISQAATTAMLSGSPGG